ncbi:hypothetical protein NC653_005514 [Populus alba x Populus x berolinensis]|uniref:Isopenicillin N synthase-like Fe(2+) 2OG dioxygenase domain-containing protein n=1 Tax=Populus alba x Populus x berolinensis TaxID=444605 RepID=A0AAD6RCE9_9ROSI|nr:hypothetical protein NC653_005514 [Populus alba x Populus x berolinensis]
MAEAGVLELYELHYSDLLLLSSTSPVPEEGEERAEKIKKTIMETLGPTGPGLLSITGVPKASILRQRLLPLASKLALLDHDRRKHILKEHNLGSDVPLKNPDRNVSSFAMQLKYAQALESAPGKLNNGARSNSNLESAHLDDNDDEVTDSPEDEFANLSANFRELGYCMMELGLRVAQICDMAIGGQELERSLLESGTAKGRLIHYHSSLDNLLIKASGRRKGSTKKQAYCEKNQVLLSRSEQKQSERCNLVANVNEVGSSGNQGNLWQQWHYDYGIFTVLTGPMFLMPSQLSENTATDQFPVLCDQDCPFPTGHSYLRIFDANTNDVLMVKTSSESFIIQVGESADILSRGKLRSTLHCVCRPPNLENLSRETFVVFLQPAWSKTFSISDYNVHHSMLGCHSSNEGNGLTELDFNEVAREIHKIVPPLSSRLKDGMTFAEFSRETTKQYYGGSGLQSNS